MPNFKTNIFYSESDAGQCSVSHCNQREQICGHQLSGQECIEVIFFRVLNREQLLNIASPQVQKEISLWSDLRHLVNGSSGGMSNNNIQTIQGKYYYLLKYTTTTNILELFFEK